MAFVHTAEAGMIIVDTYSLQRHVRVTGALSDPEVANVVQDGRASGKCVQDVRRPPQLGMWVCIFDLLDLLLQGYVYTEKV